MSAKTKRAHYHERCHSCISDQYPEHDECAEVCGGRPAWQTAKEGYKCAEPCPCECRKPFSRNEVMELRSIIEKFRR